MERKFRVNSYFKQLLDNTGLWLSVFVSVLLILVSMAQTGAMADTTDDVNNLDATALEQDMQEDIEDEIEKVEQAGETGTLKFLNFQPDTSLQKGLRILAAKYRKNIVPSANVDGTVAAGLLYDVTFEEAMNAILGYQFKWEDDGRFVWVYTAEEFEKIKMDKHRLESKVFTLYYINAEEAQKLLSPSLSEYGEIAATSAAARDTEAGSGGDSFAMRDSILVTDFPERLEKMEDMLNDLDVRPPAIMLDVTIMEASLDDTTEFGIDFSNINGGIVTALGNDGISQSGFASGVTDNGLSIGITTGNVAMLIRAIESVAETTVLANPSIMAINKQAGKLQIGTEEGYATVTQSNADGATQEVEFIETGTILEFRPYICKDGYIRMEIHPEQSTGQVRQVGSDSLPIKNITTVQTNIMVKDGKSIVIGGLFQDKIIKTRSQVPLLGDMPFIGSAFRSLDDQSIRTELIVIITPHIIYDPAEKDAVEEKEYVDRSMHGAHKSLEWLDRVRLIEDKYSLAVKDYTEGNYGQALCQLNYILDVRPRFEKAVKLREKIIAEQIPDGEKMIERIMLNKFEQEN